MSKTITLKSSDPLDREHTDRVDDMIEERLSARIGTGRGCIRPVTYIDGPAGSGKTTTLLRLAEDSASFRDVTVISAPGRAEKLPADSKQNDDLHNLWSEKPSEVLRSFTGMTRRRIELLNILNMNTWAQYQMATGEQPQIKLVIIDELPAHLQDEAFAHEFMRFSRIISQQRQDLGFRIVAAGQKLDSLNL